jgi:POT family proton-dependent oligopeptide transporter
MAKKPFLTAPDQTSRGWPPGVKYIIGNEIGERFSFYGMRAILQPHLAYLYVVMFLGMKWAGGFDTSHAIDAPWAVTDWLSNVWRAVAQSQGSHDAHMFNATAYALPMLGAILADKWIGKYLTIMTLSLVYCAGHAVLALGGDASLGGMHLGLALIALGTGGIKPCVSAHVGDQFGKANWFLTRKVFQFFYMSVNFGSFFSTLLIPWLLRAYGPHVAFGLPGVLMFIATVVFWWGRWTFVHVPAAPGGKLGLLDALAGCLLFTGVLGIWLFADDLELSTRACTIIAAPSVALGFLLFAVRQRMQPDDGFLAVLFSTIARGARRTRERLGDEAVDGVKAVFRVLSVILPISVFWALFDQHSTTWVTQATFMNLEVGPFTILPAQTASANPIMVMIFIPFLLYGVFPLVEKRGFEFTPLRRMGIGMLMAAGSFAMAALVQSWIDAGQHPSVLWLLPQYAILTMSEVLVSSTGVELSYSQAPRRMKSTVMGLWYLQITIGNLIAAAFIGNHTMNVSFFTTFAIAMAIFSVLFVARAAFFNYRDYPQE